MGKKVWRPRLNKFTGLWYRGRGGDCSAEFVDDWIEHLNEATKVLREGEKDASQAGVCVEQVDKEQGQKPG